MFAAFVTLAIGTIADIITTNMGMRQGLRESFPLSRWFMEAFGPGWWLFKVALTAAIGWALGLLGAVGVWVFAVGLCLVAANNLRLIRKKG